MATPPRTLADLGLAALELTVATPTVHRHNRVIVPLPFDIAEQRTDHVWIRTRAGTDVYVVESLDRIIEMLLAAKNLPTDPTDAPLETK